MTAAALPDLLHSRGRVVNVASGLAVITLPFSTAYTLSKRAVVAYSDVLRLEYGDRITVTSVYPGYIRTAIHERSRAAGVPLEGAVPAERVEDAARTLVRAAIGRPVRDIATTRSAASPIACCACCRAGSWTGRPARGCGGWPGAGTSTPASRASSPHASDEDLGAAGA